MRLNEVRGFDGPPVDGYGPGFFRVAGNVHDGAVLVTPSGVKTWAGYADVAVLIEAAAELDVLFIGTGAEIAHLPGPFVAALEAAGIAFETMASPPAARTYNVLLSEGRRIGAAMLPV